MASIALQTTAQDTGGEAPRVIVGDRTVPLTHLPQSARNAILQLEQGIALATGVSNSRYLIVVEAGAVAAVELVVGPIEVPASAVPMHLLLLSKTETGGRHVASAAAFAPGYVASAQEFIVTSKPQLVAQLLAMGSFEVEALDLYLATAQPIDGGGGSDYLAVMRLDEAAILLASAGFDTTALLTHIASTNWQSPERAPHSLFVEMAAAVIPEWHDVWS